MSASDLIQLIPPPLIPSEVGTDEQWRKSEEALGLQLPSDYREFIFTYGSGLFAQFYRVYNPFAASPYTALASSVERVCGYEHDFKRDWPERVPYPIYPDKPGLLPWGNDENGNDYYWLTEGHRTSGQCCPMGCAVEVIPNMAAR